MTPGFGHERRDLNGAAGGAVPDAIAVHSRHPAIKGHGRPRWWERLRSAVGLGGLIVVSGVIVAVAIAATLLALAVLVATAFG